MSGRQSQRGFAIALLLWMIAGMALTVAAVIHFASADIILAESRVRDAKLRAMGRAVAHLILRDSAMADVGGLGEAARDNEDKSAVEGATDDDKLFSKSYQFEGGWLVSAKLRPATGLVPLNNASSSELAMVFSGLGRVDDQVAERMVQGVMEYRNDFPGFRYREELLSVTGASKVVYDRIKHFVHPYRVGSTDTATAPPRLKALFLSGADDRDGAGNAASDSSGDAGLVDGEMTFALLAEQKRLRSLGDGLRVDIVEMTFDSAANGRTRARVWVSANDPDPVLFTESFIPESAVENE